MRSSTSSALDEMMDSLHTWPCPMTLLKDYRMFCPMSPGVVLNEELPDPGQLGKADGRQRGRPLGRLHADSWIGPRSSPS
jgi:hypothetical protein